MEEYFLNEVNSYLNYFGCLILGIVFAKKYLHMFPADPEEEDSFFHKFLISNTTTFAGALLGSSFYNLTYPRSFSDAPKFDNSNSNSDSGE